MVIERIKFMNKVDISIDKVHCFYFEEGNNMYSTEFFYLGLVQY